MFGVLFGQVIILALAVDRHSAVRWPCSYLLINLKFRISLVILVGTFISLFFAWLSLWELPDNSCEQCSVGAASTHLYQISWIGFGVVNAVLVIGKKLCYG
jgi:hypothetical protein